MSRRNIVIAAGFVAIVILLGVAGFYFLRPSADVAPGAAPAAPPPETAVKATDGVPDPVIGVLDRAELMRVSRVGQDIARQAQALAAQARARLEAQGSALESETRKFQEEAASLSSEARQKREADLQNRMRALQTRAQQEEVAISQAVSSAYAAVSKTMQPILTQMAKERGVNLVMDRQVIPIIGPEFDFTADVITQLDQKMPAFQVTLKAAGK